MTTQNQTRVLLVDDNTLVLRALQRVLSTSCEVVVASSVGLALEIMAETPVDVVMSDYMMDGQDGITLLKTLRDDFPDVRRILYTGAPPANIMEHLDSGLVDNLLMKPANNHIIRDLVTGETSVAR